MHQTQQEGIKREDEESSEDLEDHRGKGSHDHPSVQMLTVQEEQERRRSQNRIAWMMGGGTVALNVDRLESESDDTSDESEEETQGSKKKLLEAF